MLLNLLGTLFIGPGECDPVPQTRYPRKAGAKFKPAQSRHRKTPQAFTNTIYTPEDEKGATEDEMVR